MSSGPVEILRAAMEAVAFRFAIIAEMLETASPGEKEVIASGGGLLNSPTWTRIMADTLGRPDHALRRQGGFQQGRGPDRPRSAGRTGDRSHQYAAR